MSTSTATMSPSYTPTIRRPGFLRKLVVTILFVAGITVFMALLQAHQKNLTPFWMLAFATLNIGLAAGAAARISFYQRSGFTRFLTVLFIVPLALLLLGLLTNWQMGIGPLNTWVKGIIAQDELIQLGVAYLVAFITLDAWWKQPARIDERAKMRRTARNRKPTPSPAIVQSVQPQRRATLQEHLTFLPKKKSHLKFMKASKTRNNRSSAVGELSLRHTSPMTRLPKKGSSRRKPNLQISLYEEHRCPFCLEEVKRNDSRGIKKCEVCNTLHHADCWAVTGMCQVPHLNT